MRISVKPVSFTIIISLLITGSSSQDEEEEQQLSSKITQMFPALMQDERSAANGPCDDNTTLPFYDFIIVGGGAAGCVLANRLSEIKEWNILLIEAGRDETAIMDVPYLAGSYLQTDAAWHYLSVPSKSNARALKNRRNNYPLGKVLGGGTVMNFMFATRGNRQDFDHWEKMGNTGWGFKNILPYFKKIENLLIPEYQGNNLRSTGGHINISSSPYESPLNAILLEAVQEIGYKIGDYNADNQTVFSRGEYTMTDSTRCSAARGYLHPTRYRTNLHVKKGSTVNKILFDRSKKIATGVQYERNGVNYTARAKYEIIISAGAIKSAQLLMLSGIGPAEHLKSLNIPVIANLPVGNNFMDHAVFYGLCFTINETKAYRPSQVISNFSNHVDYFVNKKGPLTTVGPFESIGFIEVKNTSNYTPGWPNLEAILVSATSSVNKGYANTFRVSDPVYDAFFKPLLNKNTYEAILFPTRPKSRGTVRLINHDINSEPAIDPQFYSVEDDVKVAVGGIREIIKLTTTSVLQKLGAKLHDIPLPPCKNFTFDSDEYWGCCVKQLSTSLYHPSGTCKMGPVTDKTSVVSPELKVHGVKNLRVVDASVMPAITTGHLMIPTYMIAEKASDLVKKTYLKN